MDIYCGTETFSIQGALVDFLKTGGGTTPAEKPMGIFVFHVDATMRMGDAKIIMPVGAVEGMPFGGEETAPRNTCQDVIVHRWQHGQRHSCAGREA